MQKNYKVLIFNFIVVALLAISLMVFMKLYQEYRVTKINSVKVENHYKKLLNKKKQLTRIKNYAALANKVNNAIVKLNYTSQDWTDYQVNLDKGVNFSELAYILNQTQHGRDYFFVPDKLEITLSDNSLELKEKNIAAHLKLQGRYLVKR